LSDDEKLVNYRCQDGIAEIELNRPHVLNALNDEAVLELRAALDRLDRDSDAFVAIIHGRGRAFSSGADVRQRQLRPQEEVDKYGGLALPGTKPNDLLFGYAKWKPIICAVHGYVLGAALRVALLSEFIVAEEGTRFQVTETARGLSGGAAWQEMATLGAAGFASDVCLTGRFFTAEEAAAHGLIYRVAPVGGHLAAARELAATIAANPPLAVQETTRIRRVVMERVEIDNRAIGSTPLYNTDAFKERAAAFAARRNPVAGADQRPTC
jgi:enoyl-CoA hydratase/carnithine racemase